MPDEVQILTELKKGHALRHSLTPAVSDFQSSDGTPAEILSVLTFSNTLGIVDNNFPNPSADTDGVKYRWRLNFLGELYLLKRKEGSTQEQAYQTVSGRPFPQLAPKT